MFSQQIIKTAPIWLLFVIFFMQGLKDISETFQLIRQVHLLLKSASLPVFFLWEKR